MRKEKFYFIGVLLVLMCLSGCGQSKEEKLRAATDQVMKNIQVCESNIMQKVYEETREKDSTEEANEDLYQYDSMANYILDSNKKLTYDITNVDVEGLKVSVSCHYLDSSEFVTNFGLFCTLGR